MLVEGRIIKDGRDIIAYLDDTMNKLWSEGKVVTGIIIGTDARRILSEACQRVMGQPTNESETVNRYRGALLIEDGNEPYRIEVVYGSNPTQPVEGDPFSNLRKVNNG